MTIEALSHFHWTILTCIALILFLGVFLGSLVFVFWPSRKPVYDHLQSIPLQSES